MKLINQNGKFLVDSREVAKMTGKQHHNLIRDIDSYVEVINQNSDLSSDSFFHESSYESGTGKQYKCYLLTKQGCDMVANKMTGEKGILFTATYVSKFAEMEAKRNTNIEMLDERKQRVVMMQTMIDHEGRIDEIQEKVLEIEAKVDEQITLDSGEQRKVQKAVNRKVYSIAEDKETRTNYFQQLHREIKDRWAVPSYKDVRRHELDELIKYIDAWKPRAA